MHTLIVSLVHLAVLTGVVVLSSRVISGVRVKNVPTAVAVAVVFAVLNVLLGWLLHVLLFVPTVLTLGLLGLFVPLIVNAALLWLTDRVLKAFEIDHAKALWLMALAITVARWLLRFVH
jgi:uncharacterized membrane protein YvlD (DUF360 family)